MKDVEKKNIIFLSDENTPYTMEFTFLEDSEIAELVERRLFSNNYFDYTIYSIHKSKGTIVLIRDSCGHKVETSLSKIEDGLLPERCPDCRKAEKEKLLSFKKKVEGELNERGLVVVLFESGENTDSLYIECTKCGAKYYLNDDFNLCDEAWEMYCKNWVCMMDALALEDHWLANDIKSGKIIIKENNYNSDYSPFVKDYLDWVDDLNEFDGYYEFKCKKCNAVNILPFGKWECEACIFTPFEAFIIEKWDSFSDQVSVLCKECGNKYHLTCTEAQQELFYCFFCYQKRLESQYVCPICGEKYNNLPEHYDCCEFCEFPINRNIQDQTQYISWVKNTLLPCFAIWESIKPKYLKALKDLTTSLENETKLLREKKELNEKLSQCYTEITACNKKISALNEELEYKNARISQMELEQVATLSMLNQSQISVARPNMAKKSFSDKENAEYNFSPLSFGEAKKRMCALKTDESVNKFYEIFADLVKNGSWVSAPINDKKPVIAHFKGGYYLAIYSALDGRVPGDSKSIIHMDINQFIDILYGNPHLLGIVVDPNKDPFLINRRIISDLTVRKDPLSQGKDE